MKNLKELINHLNGFKILQTSCWEECIPREIWDTYFENNKVVVYSGIDADKRRHYELSTSAISFDEGIFEENGDYVMGIRHISDMYSEQSSFEDFSHTLEFFEMKPITTINYIKV